MKKPLFTLTLLAALMFCGCEGAIDPSNTPEEPFIRGTGIVDRITLTTLDTLELNSECTVVFKEQSLVVTFDKKLSFIANLWHNEGEELVFTQPYYDVSSFSISLSEFADGTYTLYIQKTFLAQFIIKDGCGYIIGYTVNEEEQTNNNDSLSSVVHLMNEIPNDELSAFFDATLPDENEVLQYFFVPPTNHAAYMYSPIDTCYLVNSHEELQALYWGERELPEIDFSKYTLVLGRKMVPSHYALEGHTLCITDESIVVTLKFRKLEGAFVQMMYHRYFWGLYEKLPKKNTIIKMITN